MLQIHNLLLHRLLLIFHRQLNICVRFLLHLQIVELLDELLALNLDLDLNKLLLFLRVRRVLTVKHLFHLLLFLRGGELAIVRYDILRLEQCLLLLSTAGLHRSQLLTKLVQLLLLRRRQDRFTGFCSLGVLCAGL